MAGTSDTRTKGEKAEHSPRPWLTVNGTDKHREAVFIKSGDTFVGKAYGHARQPVAANARLISAAPDLYEACRAAFSILHPVHGPADDPGHKVVAQLIDALAKARGEA